MILNLNYIPTIQLININFLNNFFDPFWV